MAKAPIVDEATVARIATLARIKIPADQRAQAAQELGSILNWVEQLNAVDTKDVPPMTSIAQTRLPMRPDVVTDGQITGDVVHNAPEVTADGFFLVPKVVE